MCPVCLQIIMPYEHTFPGVANPLEAGAETMEFRLLFEGLVRPTGNKGHPAETHTIRKVFHPQLRRLWESRPGLRQLAELYSLKDPNFTAPYAGMSGYGPEDEANRVRCGLELMGKNWNRSGFNCVPLVTRNLDATCSLDVLLLRPGPQMTRHVLSQGDIDGQLKTIIDALRIPESSNETGNSTPDTDEMPFFCLLEDDRLVSEVRVTADELLSLPGKPDVDPNDAHVVIRVRVTHRHPRTFDNYLG
jgi:hypothetical protein